MKKISIVAFAVIVTGLVSSCSKENNVKPTPSQAPTTAQDKGDIGTGD